MGHNTLTNVTIVNIPPKNTLGQFALQNYGALYFVKDMFINIRHIMHFNKTQKQFFVNNFCVSEL